MFQTEKYYKISDNSDKNKHTCKTKTWYDRGCMFYRQKYRKVKNAVSYTTQYSISQIGKNSK